MRQGREILGDSNLRKSRVHMDQGANFRSLKTDSVSKLRKAMPGSEPAIASTQQDRRTLLHGELNVRPTARLWRAQGANFYSLKTDSVSELRKDMPGSEPATASAQQDRRTLLHGELNARQADGETMASAGSDFLQFQN